MPTTSMPLRWAPTPTDRDHAVKAGACLRRGVSLHARPGRGGDHATSPSPARHVYPGVGGERCRVSAGNVRPMDDAHRQHALTSDQTLDALAANIAEGRGRLRPSLAR